MAVLTPAPVRARLDPVDIVLTPAPDPVRSFDELIAAIRTDIATAGSALGQTEYAVFRDNAKLVARGLQALDAGPDDIQSYGKGAIVGIDGEIEHAAALIHPRFGAPVRGALGDASEIITSTKKMGGPGATLTVPLTSKKSIWDFDHMDAAEITIPDAPHADEIVVILALAMGGRPRKRIKPD